MRLAGVLIVSVVWSSACSADSGSSVSPPSDGAGAPGAGGAAPAGAAGTGGAAAGSGGTSTGGVAAGGDASGGESSGGDAGSPGPDASAGTGGETLPDGSLPDPLFPYDAGDAGERDACASETITAEPIPLDVIVVLDKSLSMSEPGWRNDGVAADCDIDETAEPKESKWCRSINALYDFFAAPSSVQMGVAFTVFPPPEDDDGRICTAYSSLDMDFGVLSGEANDPVLAELESVMNGHVPLGRTPTEAALETIIQYSTARQAQNQQEGNASRKVIGVLVTDGIPSGSCDGNVSNLNQLVVDHYIATGIPTYFIGMEGADYYQLNVMANGAGVESHSDYCNDETGAPCFYYDVWEGDGTVLIDAMNAIRGRAISCQFAVPTSETGLVDLDTIKVKFTPRAGDAEETLDRVVGGEGSCSGDGYYTDDDTTPSIIALCPATCTRANADPTSAVNIELLCEGA